MRESWTERKRLRRETDRLREIDRKGKEKEGCVGVDGYVYTCLYKCTKYMYMCEVKVCIILRCKKRMANSPHKVSTVYVQCMNAAR